MPYIYKHRRPPEPWREFRKHSPHALLVPFFLVEWFSEWLAFLLSRWAVLEVLEYAGTLSILIGVIFYFAGSRDRLEQKHYQAWQVINTAQGKTGNGGRFSALQGLNADGVPLINIDVADAFLRGIDLHRADLSRSKLSGADMRGAVLNNANLSETKMIYTNLEGADLRGVDLDDADLTNADLTGADLSGIRNWRSIESITGATMDGVKNAPDGFIDWAKQHGATQQSAH
jgi:pentapeptide repeat protein